MQRLVMGLLGALALAVVLGFSGAARAQGQQQQRAVLILTSEHFDLDQTVAQKLGERGFQLVVRKLGQPITQEQLRLFEVVMLPDFTGVSTPVFVPRPNLIEHLTAQENIAKIKQYVSEGGGLLLAPSLRNGGMEIADVCSRFLEPWGARVLAAQVRDDASMSESKPYALTQAVGKSPVSQGVSSLWYPTNMLRWDDAYATVPIVIEDDAWQVAVRGGKQSVAAKGLQYTTWLPVENSVQPVLAAVRPVEKGRVAVLGVSSLYWLQLAYADLSRGWVGESNTGPMGGVFVETGDGEVPSHGLQLISNMLAWLAQGSSAAGLGGYSQEQFAKLPEGKPAPVPAWLNWSVPQERSLVKVLVGARSVNSDGQSTVAELADAARDAGYGVLVMTETFEHLSPDGWEATWQACQAASSDQLKVLPGIDIADAFGNRFLLLGHRNYPDAFTLSADGKRMVRTEYLSLGFGTHMTAVHRPTTTGLPHQLYKFFSGLVVYTYKEGKLVDDGLLAYQWQLDAASNPMPLVVHEVYSAAGVSQAAATGHQLYVPADSPQSAAWYLRPGMEHFWETPSLMLVSSGPVVRELSAGHAVIESDSEIEEVRLISHRTTHRLWRPGTKKVSLQWQLPGSHLRWNFLYIRDKAGRTAITPALRTGATAHYTWRCSDRQNFFGFAMNYTGTNLPDINPQLPVFGTDEGRGLWPHGGGPRLGENLAPLLEFPFAGPAAYITDAIIDQRYFRSEWEAVAFDGEPSQATSRSRVYQGKVRYHEFVFNKEWREKDRSRPMMLKEIELTLRIPAEVETAVFPAFTQVEPAPEYGYVDADGKQVTGKIESGWFDLPFGAYVGNVVVLSEGLRADAKGNVGFAAPAYNNGPLPAGTTWRGSYVRVPTEQRETMLAAMGAQGTLPYKLELTQGSLEKIAYVAHLQANDGGAAGQVTPAEQMPFTLPVWVGGLNANWDAGVWREGGKLDTIGIFEGRGIARLDVTRGGAFYVGNTIMAAPVDAAASGPDFADVMQLRMTVLRWDAGGIEVEVNNPSTREVTALLSTPGAVADRYALKQHPVTLAPGSQQRVRAGQ